MIEIKPDAVSSHDAERLRELRWSLKLGELFARAVRARQLTEADAEVLLQVVQAKADGRLSDADILQFVPALVNRHMYGTGVLHALTVQAARPPAAAPTNRPPQ
ncbi:hypothetical protein [Methylibium rhizosphaerae]|uniref:hypothetical protein n=1 Tax=Methylibium rhizosphaerae TaxID=2570323 RepID=UPI0011262EFE|nr:hypothetical protein [Methylibium rhizosphaerae]